MSKLKYKCEDHSTSLIVLNSEPNLYRLQVWGEALGHVTIFLSKATPGHNKPKIKENVPYSYDIQPQIKPCSHI